MANPTALTGKIAVVFNIASEKQIDLSKILDTLKISAGIDWTFGVGENMVNMLYHDKLTATNGQATVDISGNAIQDAFGDDCDFAALKLLYIKNTDVSEDLLLGGQANQIHIAETDDTGAPTEYGVIVIKPGGIFLWVDPSAAGLDVTSDKYLLIQAETAHVTYDIVMMGEKT